MNFDEQLIQLRKQKGLSQEQLGEQIGVSRQTISKWELGDTTPEMEKLIMLGDFFDISIDKLIGHSSADPNGSPAYAYPYPYRWHYEYKSKRSIRGIPLVHINIGHGVFKAKGLIAVGNISRGLISAGLISSGALSFGALSAGIISIGGASLGMLLSLGGLAVGTIAAGGLALGVLAFGGGAFGIYAVGGAAIAQKIAYGGYASAPIAIGNTVNGQITFLTGQTHSSAEIRNAILSLYPKTWDFIVNLFRSLA